MIISAMSVISPFGLGAEAFTAGVRSGRTCLRATDDGVPQPLAGIVPEFDLGGMLTETRNLRTLSRAAVLAVGTVALLAKEYDLTAYAPGERGTVLGGDLIAVDRAMSITRDSLTAALPFHIDTKQFPSSVMNHAAAQCAIRFELKGPNTTVTSGRVTGLSVLAYARRLHASGRAPLVLAGAVEDLNPRRSWITWHAGGGSSGALGEGCCVFLMESRDCAAAHGRAAIAEVPAVEFAVAPRPDAVAESLTACVRRALDRAGAQARDVGTAVVSASVATVELSAVAAVLDGSANVVDPACLVGDTGGASAAFQIATALAHAPQEGGLAIITAADPDGQVGCGVVRTFPHSRFSGHSW